jgi:hypothetical protein
LITVVRASRAELPSNRGRELQALYRSAACRAHPTYIQFWYVPRAEADRRRGFDPDGATPEERTRKASLFFGGLLPAQDPASPLEHTQIG